MLRPFPDETLRDEEFGRTIDTTQSARSSRPLMSATRVMPAAFTSPTAASIVAFDRQMLGLPAIASSSASASAKGHTPEPYSVSGVSAIRPAPSPPCHHL